MIKIKLKRHTLMADPNDVAGMFAIYATRLHAISRASSMNAVNGRHALMLPFHYRHLSHSAMFRGKIQPDVCLTGFMLFLASWYDRCTTVSTRSRKETRKKSLLALVCERRPLRQLQDERL